MNVNSKRIIIKTNYVIIAMLLRLSKSATRKCMKSKATSTLPPALNTLV